MLTPDKIEHIKIIIQDLLYQEESVNIVGVRMQEMLNEINRLNNTLTNIKDVLHAFARGDANHLHAIIELEKLKREEN